jgi:hypothetical protein
MREVASGAAATTFSTCWWVERASADESAAVLAVGLDQVIRRGDSGMDGLTALVRERKPAQAILGKAVDVMATAARSPESRGAISRECQSIILPVDPSRSAEGAYHAGEATTVMYGINTVSALGEGRGAIVTVESRFSVLGEDGNPLVIAVPPVGRNRPCPCGSGKKYKRCHGRRADETSLRFG